MKTLRYYTVVGIYEDNYQPFTASVRAENPMLAIDAVKVRIPEGCELVIAGVFIGVRIPVDGLTAPMMIEGSHLD